MLASGPSHRHSDSIMSEPSAPPIPPPPPPPFAIDSFAYAPSTRFPVNTPNQNNSPVPVPSPASATPPAGNSPAPWSTGLCDCFTDCSSCCLTCWCPCVTFGRIAEIVDRGATTCGVSGALYTLLLCLAGCSCLYSCFYRSKLRGQYFLEESPCIDCCVHCWCEGCALCQEYRELKNRGFDMSIGWYGNVERHRRGGVELDPVVPAGMTR